MADKSKIFTLLYVIISSLSVLVMLTTSFVLFEKKYLPAFMLAQKYALPIIISAMSTAFITFFEPERLAQRNTLLFMRIVMGSTLIIFSYYLTTLNFEETSFGVWTIFIIQWAAIFGQTMYYFILKNKKTAQ